MSLRLPLIHQKDINLADVGGIILQKKSQVHTLTQHACYTLDTFMKSLIRISVVLIISLLLMFFSVAFSRSISAQSAKFADNTGAALFFQTTTTPQPQVDRSEIGSTDGITVLSFVIVAIIITPILLQRKHWSHT